MKNPLFDRVLPLLQIIGWLATGVGLSMRWALLLVGERILIPGLMMLGLVYMLLAYAPAKLPVDVYLPLVEPAPDENHSVITDTVAPQLVGLGALFLFVGILFKLRFWSGGPTMLLAGILAAGSGQVLLSPVGRLSRQYLLVILLGATMLAVPAETLLQPFHRNDPVLTQLLLYRLHHPRDRAADEAVRQYWQARPGRSN